ncbi:MAG: OmpA family protein, partial [Bacteroidales bacterium]|nr:OmpA family protein [Bacteroidales bacterium]
SNISGTMGGYDIWKTTRSKKNKPFGTPVNLGSNVNSYDHEMSPTLVNDTSLYFASKGHVGLGGYDIFVSHKDGEENWTKAENLKYPINSESDDYGIIFDNSTVLDPISGFPYVEKGYFTSNRAGGRGEDDIWIFKLRPLMFTLSGFVRDSVTRQFVDGATVTISGSDGTSYKTTTDIRGYYSFDKNKIAINVTYDIFVQKSGYYENDNSKGRETTVGLTENKDLKRDFIINPIPKEPVVLPDILYDLAKWELKPQYQDSLMGLYTIMKDNPTLVIELRSHTDVRPIPMTNDTLSQRRAQSCVNFLVDSLGVDPERLVAKGYGERISRKLERDIVSRGITFKKGTVLTPDYIKSLPKNQQEAAHDLNRRTEFLILRDDYVPKTEVSPVSSDGRVEIMVDKYIPIEVVNGKAMGTCYVNSKTLKFVIEPNSDTIKISYDQALKYLKEAIFTVGDFELKEKAISEKDGSIIDGSIVFFNTLQIGDELIENVEAVVVKEQKEAVIIGANKFIEEFGTYRIDEQTRRLIFD